MGQAKNARERELEMLFLEELKKAVDRHLENPTEAKLERLKRDGVFAAEAERLNRENLYRLKFFSRRGV
jgi:hypothetical protein